MEKFDIIIGNPPYIDSESMTVANQNHRKAIMSKYANLSGNWDIYMAFFSFANAYSDIVSFITPYKWITKPYGKAFRNEIVKNKLHSIVLCKKTIFEKASVSTVITSLTSHSKTVYFLIQDKDQFKPVIQTELKNLDADNLIQYFSNHNDLIKKIESNSFPLKSFCTCEPACSTGDAYALIPYIEDASPDQDLSAYFKLINTGTISKYHPLWGEKPICYLKSTSNMSPTRPIISKANFQANFGKTYIKRASSPKIIIKGIALLECFTDKKAEYIPGKSTLVICSENIDLLNKITSILNSKLAIFYLLNKYVPDKAFGSIVFTPDMINQFPIKPSVQLTTDVYKQYNLTDTEIQTIEKFFQ